MLARAALVVALLLPGVAEAQFSLDVTPVGAGVRQDAPATTGACGNDACRATLPLQLRGDLCVLNLRVGAPNGDGRGRIDLALGPCRSGRVRAIAGDAAAAGYHVDQFGAASLVLTVPVRPDWRGNAGMDDAVQHMAAALRLDIIATAPH